ncbi:hypothetical protein B0H19DRAFT_319212 [Mycena capillaripes]|nr:hypothetical protein B0H19DRAFT_319212 [Mycena capillaripes]
MGPSRHGRQKSLSKLCYIRLTLSPACHLVILVNDIVPLSARAALGLRIGLTFVFTLGLIYFFLIAKTFRRYGDPLDEQWINNLLEWSKKDTNSEYVPGGQQMDTPGTSWGYTPPVATWAGAPYYPASLHGLPGPTPWTVPSPPGPSWATPPTRAWFGGPMTQSPASGILGQTPPGTVPWTGPSPPGPSWATPPARSWSRGPMSQSPASGILGQTPPGTVPWTGPSPPGTSWATPPARAWFGGPMTQSPASGILGQTPPGAVPWTGPSPPGPSWATPPARSWSGGPMSQSPASGILGQTPPGTVPWTGPSPPAWATPTASRWSGGSVSGVPIARPRTEWPRSRRSTGAWTAAPPPRELPAPVIPGISTAHGRISTPDDELRTAWLAGASPPPSRNPWADQNVNGRNSPTSYGSISLANNDNATNAAINDEVSQNDSDSRSKPRPIPGTPFLPYIPMSSPPGAPLAPHTASYAGIQRQSEGEHAGLEQREPRSATRSTSLGTRQPTSFPIREPISDRGLRRVPVAEPHAHSTGGG